MKLFLSEGFRQSARSILVFGGAALIAMPPVLSAREFTSSDGKKLEAEIVSATDKKVVLDSGGKKFTVPLNRLSKEDQAFVKEWAKENPSLPLEFTFTKERLSKSGSANNKTEEWQFKVAIENRGDLPAKEIEVKYALYIAYNDKYAEDKKRGFHKPLIGEGKIPVIEAKKKVVFETAKVEVKTVDTRTKSGGTITLRDFSQSLEGITIAVIRDGKEVLRESDGRLPEDADDLSLADAEVTPPPDDDF
ncbi:MAG: hypothetical protein R3F11_17945 [Verrucomicrobiales bacterium]